MLVCQQQVVLKCYNFPPKNKVLAAESLALMLIMLRFFYCLRWLYLYVLQNLFQTLSKMEVQKSPKASSLWHLDMDSPSTLPTVPSRSRLFLFLYMKQVTSPTFNRTSSAPVTDTPMITRRGMSPLSSRISGMTCWRSPSPVRQCAYLWDACWHAGAGSSQSAARSASTLPSPQPSPLWWRGLRPHLARPRLTDSLHPDSGIGGRREAHLYRSKTSKWNMQLVH